MFILIVFAVAVAFVVLSPFSGLSYFFLNFDDDWVRLPALVNMPTSNEILNMDMGKYKCKDI